MQIRVCKYIYKIKTNYHIYQPKKIKNSITPKNITYIQKLYYYCKTINIYFEIVFLFSLFFDEIINIYNK